MKELDIGKKYIKHQGSEHLLSVHHIAFFGSKKPEKIGFVYLTANVALPDNPSKKVSGITFIRGDSVAVLVVVNHHHIILVKQPRVPVGQDKCVEMLAGMRDGNTPALIAATQELLEEADIKINPKEMTNPK